MFFPMHFYMQCLSHGGTPLQGYKHLNFAEEETEAQEINQLDLEPHGELS